MFQLVGNTRKAGFPCAHHLAMMITECDRASGVQADFFNFLEGLRATSIINISARATKAEHYVHVIRPSDREEVLFHNC